jgi:hypothetical protein
VAILWIWIHGFWLVLMLIWLFGFMGKNKKAKVGMTIYAY